MIVLFRVGRDQLLVGLGLSRFVSRFSVGLPLFLVFTAEQVKKRCWFCCARAVDFFLFCVELFAQSLCRSWPFRGFRLGVRSFLFERHEDNFLLSSRGWLVCFTSSSALGVFFWAFVRHFLFARWRQGKCLFCFARLIFLFGYVGFAQLFAFFVWLSRFFCFCFSRGRDNFLVGLWEFCFNVRPLPI